MMLFLILCSIAPVGANAQPSTPIQSQVESVLDGWQGWKAARESLLKSGTESDVVGALGKIAQAGEQSYARRSHAIELLATFKSDESVKMLEGVTIGADPVFRCVAIRSLAAIGSKSTVPILINKLDDRAVCMQMQSTDPARADDVYVSDLAVGALEQVTGQTIGEKSSSGHRATQPWKEWWAKQHQRGAATSRERQCFSIHVRLNGKPLDGPQVITLKTKQDENTISLEQGCFKVPPIMLNEKAIAVSFTLPGNKIDIGTVATGLFTGVWDIELEDKKFDKDTPLPKHTRARDACAIVFHMGDEPERGLSVVPCRTPLRRKAARHN